MRFINVVDGREREPDFLDYPARTPGRIDAILIWHDPAARADRAALEELEQRMRPNYELDFVSQPRGWARLYRPRSRR